MGVGDRLLAGDTVTTPTAAPAITCASITARQRHDAKHGRTTSQAAVEFIRRTCPCDECSDWRKAQPKTWTLQLRGGR